MEGGVRVWELGELEEGREGPWIEVKPWGTLARCGRERGPDLSYRRPSSPLSRGQEIPSFPSRGKVDIFANGVYKRGLVYLVYLFVYKYYECDCSFIKQASFVNRL